ncbi:MAG: helix-turn-helix transcriptional regulator [Thermomicrobiales bacterium]
MDTLAQDLGQAIRRRRLEAGLSQEALAERADIHRNHIGFLERGERSPTVEVLARIASALEVPPWVLLWEATERAIWQPVGE